MDIDETIKKLDYDIQQIDHSIDILNYLLDSDFPSPNGKTIISNNVTELWEVQHHLLSLRADLLKQEKQNNTIKTL